MTKSTKGKISFVSALSSVSALIAIFVFIFGIPSIPDFFKGEKISTQAIDTEKVKEATISSKYAPENFLSGSWINDSCIISIQKEKNLIVFRFPKNNKTLKYRNVLVNSGVITFNFPYYVNSKDNISQNAGKLDIIVNGEDGFYINFFTYEKEFFHQKRGIPLYLTRVNGESMVSLGVGITFFCFFILFTILIATAANPSDSGSLRFLFLLLMYMLAAFCAFFDITPLNSSFETLNRIITKIVNNDSIYIIVAKWEDAINNKDFYNL